MAANMFFKTNNRLVLYFQTGSEMEVDQYTAEIVSSIKSWSYNTLYNALEQSRKDEEKKQILQRLYKQLEELVRRDPLQYVLDYVYHSVAIMKRPN